MKTHYHIQLQWKLVIAFVHRRNLLEDWYSLKRVQTTTFHFSII